MPLKHLNAAAELLPDVTVRRVPPLVTSMIIMLVSLGAGFYWLARTWMLLVNAKRAEQVLRRDLKLAAVVMEWFATFSTLQFTHSA